jgi:hypothetical protein
VNNDNIVNYWWDSWNGQPPLSKSIISQDIIIVLEYHWGTKLSHYVANVCIMSGKVNWKNLNELPLTNQELAQFKEILASLQVFMSRSVDKILWAPAKDGIYSIKEGYKILQQNGIDKVPCRAFSFCWNHVVLPKAGCFAWLTIKHRILTSDRLSRLHIAPSFNCLFCNECEEIVDHLLLTCPFASQCWNFILNKLNYSTPLQNTIWEVFQAWPVLYPKSLFANLWKCILALVVWAIWWERNKCIFQKRGNYHRQSSRGY